MTRVPGFLPPMKPDRTRKTIDDAVENFVAFHEERGRLLGRSWQSPWQRNEGDGSVRAKSRAKLSRVTRRGKA
jgi:hypothetical protein